MSHDFEKISASLRIHFCPQCKASFGCILDEDGDCDCEGGEFNWKSPWCPQCAELAKMDRCECAMKEAHPKQLVHDFDHAEWCPCYKPPTIEDVAEAFKKDLDHVLGRPLGVRIMG